MAKVHVLADETLGGTLREYVEVNRRAEVGESVYTIISEEFRKVTRVEGVGAYLDDGGLVFHENYRVLEPTDIVHIDGERFRMVDRKAEVGERVLVKDGAQSTDECNHGKSFEVTEIYGPMLVDADGTHEDGSPLNLVNGDYFVLVPVESELTAAEPPESLHDIIANLVRRVAQLESELTGAKRDIETWAQEVETLRYTNTELYSRLGHVEQDTDDLDEKVEMCIDDIVTLDERTNLSQEITINVAEFVKLIGGARR